MKKLSFLGLTLLLGSFVIGTAVATPSQIQPNTQANTQIGTAASSDQNLNITSDMLGIHGPFSLSTIYSKTYGLILQGKYTQLLNPTNAFALELDGGKAERRVGITWGHILTKNQRIKLTAENLSQKMNFDFDSGQVSKWVSQNAIGGTYEYLLPYKLIKDINLNAYYSKAHSKDLGYKDYTQDGFIWRNYRRIAGGTDKHGSVGVDLSPMKSTLVGLNLDYDKIKYDTRYQTSNNDSSGLGATVSLHQLVNQKVQFSLLASDRKPYKDYQAEVDWLLHSAPGTQLQLGLIGERIDGNLGLPNDNRVGLQLSYSWGGDSEQPATFSDPTPNNDAGSLKDWTNTPAVHMSQVLAIKDQKTVKIGPASHVAPQRNDQDFYYNSAKYGEKIIKTEKGNQPISDMSYGTKGDFNSLLFINSGYRRSVYPVTFVLKNTTTYKKGYTPQSKLSVTSKPWTQQSKNVQDYNYILTINGTPVREDFVQSTGTCDEDKHTHVLTFDVIATLQGYSPTTTAVAHFVIEPDTKIFMTGYDKNYEEGRPVTQDTVMDIQTTKADIDPSSIKIQEVDDLWHVYNLAAPVQQHGRNECYIHVISFPIVTGAGHHTVFHVVAKDKEGNSATGTFTIAVHAAPSKSH